MPFPEILDRVPSWAFSWYRAYERVAGGFRADLAPPFSRWEGLLVAPAGQGPQEVAPGPRAPEPMPVPPVGSKPMHRSVEAMQALFDGLCGAQRPGR